MSFRNPFKLLFLLLLLSGQPLVLNEINKFTIYLNIPNKNCDCDFYSSFQNVKMKSILQGTYLQLKKLKSRMRKMLKYAKKYKNLHSFI